MDVQPIEDIYSVLGIIPACEGFSRAGDALVDRWRSAGARLAAARPFATSAPEHAAQAQRIADRARALRFPPVHDMAPIEEPCNCDICNDRSRP